MFRFIYKILLKPVFFLFDPENVHDLVTEFGMFLGKFHITRKIVRALFYFEHPMLEQKIAGINFKNPIGLAAGFDKDANLTQIIPEIGFGFEEIGSVTGEPCAGNSGQRLWRLKKSKSLMVYYGLKNQGAEKISGKLKKMKFARVLGVSIAKTNNQETVEESAGIKDYAKAYETFRKENIGDYFTINISCPNTFGGEPFTDPEKLDRLLANIKDIESKYPNPTPIFLKLPAELPLETVGKILDISTKYKITGLVCTNLAKNRSNPNIKEKAPDVGGMSGKIVRDLSDNLIKYIYTKTKDQFVIVGCGGIFSAKDAYRKIKNGASLLQLITGMIFEGPQLISEIKIGLVELLKKDGYRNISEAVGTGV